MVQRAPERHAHEPGDPILNAPSVVTGTPIRAAIVGTGYIAEFHARGIRNADGVELVAVCDANATVATAFGASWGVPAYSSLETMVAEQRIDAVHVLVPPDLHHPLAKMALGAGAHVFLEKPMCVSADQTRELLALATARGLSVGVNHSMLFEGAYRTLRGHVRTGDLGPLDHVTLNYFTELALIRFGPFGNWMLREPGNTLLEIGPHPISGLVDLIGVPDEVEVTADRDIVLPGGARVYRRWRVHARAGRTTADVNVELGPGFPQRTIAARGLLGAASADLDANICTIDRRTPRSLDFDRYKRSLALAAQTRSQARSTLADYVLTKAKLTKRGNPYQVSIQESIARFYEGLRSPGTLDSRIDGDFGRSVIETCERIIAKARLQGRVERPRVVGPVAGLKPNILVIGGTGFIGRHLIKQLLDQGHAVRAAGRGSSPVLEELGSDELEIVRADVRSEADLERILDGVEYVFHLATSSNAKTWAQYVEGEVEPTRALARACLDRGVKRLIYTGTIDSYYAGRRAGTITETTPLDRNIRRRNYYARAKAAAENLLIDMHRREGLPVVVLRPGIVIGRGGNPFHWGVGKWSSEGVVETWGDGTNKLPLVLVDDVAAGLVRAMEVPGIEGRSYNLIDAPMLSARDYIAALERLGGFKVDVHRRPIWRFYLADLVKWPVKLAVGHPDGSRIPSYSDWESRTQKAHFDSSRTREELRWAPISDPERMVTEGIGGSLAAWAAARG
jgi:nucleoside-diphosphate-sugar epimerase/predicted dehydrogenase